MNGSVWLLVTRVSALLMACFSTSTQVKSKPQFFCWLSQVFYCWKWCFKKSAGTLIQNWISDIWLCCSSLRLQNMRFSTIFNDAVRRKVCLSFSTELLHRNCGFLRIVWFLFSLLNIPHVHHLGSNDRTDGWSERKTFTCHGHRSRQSLGSDMNQQIHLLLFSRSLYVLIVNRM